MHEKLETTYVDDLIKKTEFSVFPFKAELSLKPLIDFWKDSSAGDFNEELAAFSRKILNEIESIPELSEPFHDESLLEKYRGQISLLLNAVFPAAFWKTNLSSIMSPFVFKTIYASPRFEKELGKNFDLLLNENISMKHMDYGKTIIAYFHILRSVYKFDLDFDYPLVIHSVDPETGLYKIYNLQYDMSFVRIKTVGSVPKLSKEDINGLLADFANLNKWQKVLPPENFQFEGFIVLTAVDVTQQEIISSLKLDLIERDAIISAHRFENIQHKMRCLLGNPNIDLGLATAYGDVPRFTEFGKKIGHSFIINAADKGSCCPLNNSIYSKVIEKKEYVIIDDLKAIAIPSAAEIELIKQGYRSILIAPLTQNGQIIGILELASPNPGDISTLSIVKIKDALYLFSMAVKRFLEERNDKIQSIIKEKCTAIHKSVEWKFRRAAVNYLDRVNAGETPYMDEIIFDNVFPLYGATDVRGSSILRNTAIQSDLQEQLNRIREILVYARQIKYLPIFDEIDFRIINHIMELRSGINSGDEVAALEFITKEIDPLFEHISKFDSSIRDLIDVYKIELDMKHGLFFKHRRDFEDSLNMINNSVSKYLESEENKAQEMFPHYYEKYKTDGIEYNMYLGSSLMENGEFDEFYLKNLRLWQIILTCGIVKRTLDLKSKLKTPLETTHLILVHSAPLTIRFRYDEKKFDVEGTYNLRYEIMKKRIDKATIKGTQERLTQPGKIAIVYAHEKECAEYMKYLDYLKTADYIEDEIEEFELENLQGLYGLKALRISVKINSPILQNV